MRAIVTVIGRDQVGIIAAVCALLSEKNVNVLDISQTVLQEYFTMIMLVDASQATVPFARLREDLTQKRAVRALGRSRGRGEGRRAARTPARGGGKATERPGRFAA